LIIIISSFVIFKLLNSPDVCKISANVLALGEVGNKGAGFFG